MKGNILQMGSWGWHWHILFSCCGRYKTWIDKNNLRWLQAVILPPEPINQPLFSPDCFPASSVVFHPPLIQSLSFLICPRGLWFINQHLFLALAPFKAGLLFQTFLPDLSHILPLRQKHLPRVPLTLIVMGTTRHQKICFRSTACQELLQLCPLCSVQSPSMKYGAVCFRDSYLASSLPSLPETRIIQIFSGHIC